MNLTLIGMPGAGKSSIGKAVAGRLNLRFIDTDELIRQQTGLTIGESLTRLGDELFIQLEEKVVLQLGNFDNCIVSPGGSVIYSQKAMDFLKQRSFVIFLSVPVEVIIGPELLASGAARFHGALEAPSPVGVSSASAV